MLQWPSPASPVPSLALYSPGQSTPNLGLFTMLHLFSFPVATVSHAGGSQLTAPCKLQDPGSVRTQVPGHGTPWAWRQDVNCIVSLWLPDLVVRLLTALDSAPGVTTCGLCPGLAQQHLAILFSLSLLQGPGFLLSLCKCPGWRRTCNSRWLPATMLDALK